MIVFQIAFGKGEKSIPKKPIDYFIEGRRIYDVQTLTAKFKELLSGKFKGEGIPVEASFRNSVAIHDANIIKLLAGYIAGRKDKTAALANVTNALNNALVELKKEAEGNIRRVEERIARLDSELVRASEKVRNRMGISNSAVEDYEKFLKSKDFPSKVAARTQRRQEQGLSPLGNAGVRDTAKKVGTFPTEQGARDAERRLEALAERKGYGKDYTTMFKALEHRVAAEKRKISSAISELRGAVQEFSKIVGLIGGASDIKDIKPDLVKEAKSVFTRALASIKDGSAKEIIKDFYSGIRGGPTSEQLIAVYAIAATASLVALMLYSAYGKDEEPETKGEILFVPSKVKDKVPKKADF
ncbi:hypothetical protein J4450_02280 [Candidatus Micrarchaeota archaeon]|nr:hypothetical protein [Candidatus Micrarchaeota archaeon]